MICSLVSLPLTTGILTFTLALGLILTRALNLVIAPQSLKVHLLSRICRRSEELYLLARVVVSDVVTMATSEESVEMG